MIRSRLSRCALMCLAASACTGTDVPPEREVETVRRPIADGDDVVAEDSLDFVAQVETETSSCTGTLIHHHFVVTAQHCVTGTNPFEVTVRLGNRKRSEGEPRGVRYIFRKPGYSGVGDEGDDIALLQLRNGAPQAPAELPREAEAYLWDGVTSPNVMFPDDMDRGLTVGWGLDESGAAATTLQKRGAFITRKDGLVVMADGPDHLPLAGTKPGDSGGPLLVGTGLRRDRIVGVYSEGYKAGQEGAHTAIGYYANIGDGENRRWIQAKLDNFVDPMIYTTVASDTVQSMVRDGAAADPKIKGSFAVRGDGSGAAETALLAGTQQVAAMTRALGPAACASHDGAAHAAGLVFACDGIIIVGGRELDCEPGTPPVGPNGFPAYRQLYLNTLVGFRSVNWPESVLVQDLGNKNFVNTLATSHGFTPVRGRPFCVDFDEVANCGAEENHDACQEYNARLPQGEVTMAGAENPTGLTQDVLALCPAAGGVTFAGTTSAAAEQALIDGQQTVAVMAAPLGPAACNFPGGASRAASYAVGPNLYLNTMAGFSTLNGQERALASCFSNDDLVAPILAAHGLAGGPDVTCVDFDEVAQCGASVNRDACATELPDQLRAVPRILVASNVGYAVETFDVNGQWIGTFASTQPYAPFGFAQSPVTGEVFVSTHAAPILRYSANGAPSPTAPSLTTPQPDNPVDTLVFDSSGNLYVATYYQIVSIGDEQVVYKYAAADLADANPQPVDTIATGLATGDQLAFDRHGNLCLASLLGQTVRCFDPATHAVTADYGERMLAADASLQPSGVAFDEENRLYTNNSPAGQLFREQAPGGPMEPFAPSQSPSLMLLTIKDGALYVPSYDPNDSWSASKVYRVDPATGAVTPFITSHLLGTIQMIFAHLTP